MGKEIKKKITPIVLDTKTLIEQSRQQIAVSVNAAMTLMYWKICKKINGEVQQNKRAEYGKQIVATLSGQLSCSRTCSPGRQ